MTEEELTHRLQRITVILNGFEGAQLTPKQRSAIDELLVERRLLNHRLRLLIEGREKVSSR